MLRHDAEAESWALQLTGEEQQRMTIELNLMSIADRMQKAHKMEENYKALFGCYDDVDVDPDKEEVEVPAVARKAFRFMPTTAKHPPPPPPPPKHQPTCRFVPAADDADGQWLRYQKDKHNERERNRKARRALEKMTSKAGAGSSANSSSALLRPLLCPPPPPPAKRSSMEKSRPAQRPA
jgi:hypothetical protein